ncbi:MAG: hypothetical protein ACI3YH_03230 [Eubacteriales bacterium]
MTYTQFREIVLSIDDCTDLDHFIAERGWQEWMDDYDTDRIVEILTAVWGLKCNPIKGIKQAAKHTNQSLSQTYGIPIRTVEDWSRSVRACPIYTWTMLAYCVFADSWII